MATCPACGIDSPEAGGECPRCHLAISLFPAVKEAAAGEPDSDPTYLRTIGELLATVDVERTATRPSEPAQSLLSRPSRSSALSEVPPATSPPARAAASIERVVEYPPEPSVGAALPEVRRRLEEYFQIGRRLGLDFTEFESRAGSAALVGDLDSLEILAREMFVHLSSSIAEEYESALARRNELAQLFPTASADVELTAVRRAIGVGDLSGAQRRLAHVRDELAHLEEQWEVGRILVTEGDLMVRTIRELGGDPSPAAGPLDEGRKLFAEGRRAESERVLARAAVALWTVLEPMLLRDLQRLRDRMVEQRSAGLDIEPAVRELRALSIDLRRRNLVGTIVSYHHLKSAVDRAPPDGAETVGKGAPASEVRSFPPA